MNPQLAANALKNTVRAVLFGGVAVYGAANSLFTVEGGHKAIVFNRLVGIKDNVSARAGRLARRVRAAAPGAMAPHAARPPAADLL
jgi:hypothetical protein